jgi:cytochrome b6-f complex iron-sulfur subunit
MQEKAEEIKASPHAQSGDIGHLWSRRDFYSFSGLVVVVSVLLGSLVAFLRFMFPRALFEPKVTFKGGTPDDYPVGTVSEKFIATQGVWIVRTPEGFYTLAAVCTHLGCTPKWLEFENKFICPCHGSGFARDGINFEGPAPRALERLKVALTEEGELLVDKSQKFIYEKGEWENSILKI